MPRPLYLRGNSHRYPFQRKLGGPQSWSGRRGETKIPYLIGTQTPKPGPLVASQYTDSAIPGPLITYSSMNQSLAWDPDSFSADQEILRLLRNPRVYYCTVFTTACPWTLPWGSWIQTTNARPITSKFILILSSHICLDLWNTVVISGFLATVQHAFLTAINIATLHIPWQYIFVHIILQRAWQLCGKYPCFVLRRLRVRILIHVPRILTLSSMFFSRYSRQMSK
jgi:hypothetical protein